MTSSDTTHEVHLCLFIHVYTCACAATHTCTHKQVVTNTHIMYTKYVIKVCPTGLVWLTKLSTLYIMDAAVFDVCRTGRANQRYCGICKDQKTTLCSLFPSSTFTWALGNRTKSPGLGDRCLLLLKHVSGPNI